MRRAAPGPQVSSGRLRVDAARAIAKLREYQLAERAAWILEGVRAAVASGATNISVRGDANDIWLEWQGPPWDTELLPRLFDELVSPEPAAELQHARLLAAAVNSALGMNPAYVDVYSVTSATAAHRVRYTPDVLAEPETELGEAKLRHVAVEAAEAPSDLAQGMHVHVRRRVSLEVVGYLFGEPPELPIVRANCADIAVPLTIDDEVLHRKHDGDLLRVPLGDGLDGFVAITTTPQKRCELAVAERGVVLARYPIELIGHFTDKPLPLRVFIDAERLPTNASRSQVRQDVHPISTAEQAAKRLTGAAIAELATLAGRGATGARTAALTLLAANFAGPPASWIANSTLSPLTKLPLLRNAFGEPCSTTTPWRGEIYTGRKALDGDLKEWVGDVLWLEDDDAAARALLGTHTPDKDAIRLHLKAARQQRRAHRRFLAHAKRDLHVKTAVEPRIRAQLGVPVAGSCIPDTLFRELRGEVCVHARGTDAAIVVLLDGRELERVELLSPLAFDAVIESTRLRPAASYRGVARGEAFTHAYQATRAAVVRAVEAFVTGSDDVEIDARADAAADMTLVRRAVALAHELGMPLGGPLVDAPAWLTVTGERVSFAALKAGAAVGVVRPETALVPPAGRIVVVGNNLDASELRRLLGDRVVSYQPAAGVVARVTPARLAAELTTYPRAACLAVREGELVAAIAPSNAPTIALHHMGKSLGEEDYKHTFVPCQIAIDSDAIVPDDGWTSVRDDASLTLHNRGNWELALLRAIARTMLGQRPPELVSPEEMVLDDANGLVLCKALKTHVPAAVLGEELLEAFLTAPLFALLGKTGLHSVRQIAAQFPNTILYVDAATEQIDDFSPLVASETIATLVGTLAGRDVTSGQAELERRKRKALFESRYAAHLAAPARPVALPVETISAPVAGVIASGIVGALPDGGAFEIRVFVQGRPFAVAHPPDGYPLVAVVDIAPERCDEMFGSVPADVVGVITKEVIAAIPVLVEAIATQDPVRLDSPPLRALLATWFARATVGSELLEVLRTAPAFKSIQGTRISIADAAQPSAFLLSTAAWADTWLPPGDGESRHELDGPIIRLDGPRDDLASILEVIHEHTVGDVTADVARLQARRRMARGLIPSPKLPGFSPEQKRELKAFGELAAKLGHGEIGLAVSTKSSLLIHEQGQLLRHVDLDVIPSIHLAVEDPHEQFDFEAIRNLAQQLTVELVGQIVEASTELLPALRRQLARGVLANRIPPSLVAKHPPFLCTDGRWVGWDVITEQLEKYGDVWAIQVFGSVAPEPLDPERIVLVLDGTDIDLAASSGHKVINARLELELDAKARANRDQPPARKLELPVRSGVLAEQALNGDGKRGPRGIVAVLAPNAASHRRVMAHRKMVPLGVMPDVCKWPTIAVIDDARIEPDRTWVAPKQDETWQAIAKTIRIASEEALSTIGEVPEDVLAQLRVTNHVCADVYVLRDAPQAIVRGVVWLTGLPYQPTSFRVHDRNGLRIIPVGGGLGVGGWIAVHSPDTLDVERVVFQLAQACHGKLVRALIKANQVDRDVIAAHAAHALGSKTVRPTEISGVDFPCFRPRPLSPRGLATILRGSGPVTDLSLRSRDPDLEGFFDDRTELTRVVRAHLGDRLTHEAPRPKKVTLPQFSSSGPPPPPPTPVSALRPAPPPAPRKQKAHVLQPLVDALDRRVGQLGLPTNEWSIDDVKEPMFAFSEQQLAVAGNNAVLRDIAGRLASDDVTAMLAIDALAAHVVTILNVALTNVTDATEVHALGVLLATPPSAGRRRSRQSS